MSEDQFTRRLRIASIVKWRLFNKLREEFEKINFLNYEKYKKDLEQIPDSLIEEWSKIEEEFKNDPNLKSLKGFLYEALFYYACLKTETTFKDAEILEMLGVKVRENEYPPWFEVTPLYDVIPPLHHIHEKGKIIKNPQTKCDFLVTYVGDEGPLPPALVDVKSKKPRRDYIKKFEWQIISAMRRGFIFQLAYPKEGIKYPKSLKEWEIMTYCSKCKELSKSYRECDKCGEIIFPFTIVDAYYKKK